MSYEYKESIISDLVDMLELPSGVWKYTQKLNELHEVYAKAEAFDKIQEHFGHLHTPQGVKVYFVETVIENVKCELEEN